MTRSYYSHCATGVPHLYSLLYYIIISITTTTTTTTIPRKEYIREHCATQRPRHSKVVIA